MELISGIILLLVAAGMVVVGRPAAGQDTAPFLRLWIAGQAYVLIVLVLCVGGFGLLIRSLFA